MTPEQSEIIRGLCQSIATERDPDRFTELVQELKVWLESFSSSDPNPKSATR
jgi:hypothetical protein